METPIEGTIDDRSVVMEEGCDDIEEEEEDSFTISSSSLPDSIKKLSLSDLDVGELVGSGSFARVYRVKLCKPEALLMPPSSPQHMSSSNSNFEAAATMLDKSLMLGGDDSEEERSTFTGSSRYSVDSSTGRVASLTFAMKRLNVVTPCPTTDRATHIGTTDAQAVARKGIQFEARLLSQLLPRHAHIVRMYAISSDLYEKPDSGFLLLEYLGETLEERLHKWRVLKAMEKESMTVLVSCQRFFDRRRGLGPEQRFRIKRIALGIADALRFLHEHRILYRDLKPANVGFDDTGRVRLFDFDLSREYKEEDAGKLLTGCIGSLRYMSPECARGQRYGFASDVHSYAILLWEICTLQRPYSHVKSTPHLAKVAFLGHERPSLRRVASPDVKALLQSGWNPNPDARPSFAEVVSLLRSLGASGRRK